MSDPKPVKTVTPARAGASDELTENDLQAADKLTSAYKSLSQQLARVIVGQDKVIEELLIALFSRGHCILEGVPGLAKTLMISTLSKCLSLAFSRIQFTPDLMPSDITGTEVIEENRSTGHREFKFLEGPLFANVILADEINRTPPKTQAALLEAPHARRPCPSLCRSGSSPSAAYGPRPPPRPSSGPRRTRSSRKTPPRCPHPS